MIGAGIFPGNYVFVKRQQTANEGDLVIALFDGKNNLKKLGLDKKQNNTFFIPVIRIQKYTRTLL